MSTCCNRMFHAFQMYVAYVLSGCCKNRSGIAYVAMAIDVCCKCMFQMFQPFQMYVAVVIHICCKCFICMLHMFHTYIANMCYLNVVVAIHICCKHMFVNVSPISDVYCRSASFCNISRHRKRTHADAVPMGIAVPTCMHINRHEAGISRHEAHMCMHRRTSM